MSIAEVTTNTHKSILKEIKNNLKKKKKSKKTTEIWIYSNFIWGFTIISQVAYQQ